jgi:hypothetical protein
MHRKVLGEFYLCPLFWADRAAEALPSSGQLILAFRLYRCWRLRKQGEDIIVASNLALAGLGFSRDAKRQMLRNLAGAELLRIVEQLPGKAPRVRILDEFDEDAASNL